MTRLFRFWFAALALSAPFAAASTARAEEPPAKTHGHRLRPARRAKAGAEQAGRAPRDGVGDPKPHDPKARVPVEKSESVGSPNDGHLKGGRHIDLSRPYFRVVPVYESGDVRWGMPQLVNMIDRAARSVNRRFPGSVLDVGDISQRGGGDVSRHHSHETGRDADLGFYVVDAKGKQIHAHTFIKFDPGMTSPTVAGARYDLARNWAFVQELLTDPVARVSHIFIAEWIRHELLAYAKPRSSHALWERAALVMMQPHNSLPHDDHIHVRISCPREARSSCIELAKAAPHAHLAHKGTPGGRVLHTPPHAHPASHAASHKAPAASAVTRDVPALPVAPPEGDEPGFDVGGDSAID